MGQNPVENIKISKASRNLQSETYIGIITIINNTNDILFIITVLCPELKRYKDLVIFHLFVTMITVSHTVKHTKFL